LVRCKENTAQALRFIAHASPTPQNPKHKSIFRRTFRPQRSNTMPVVVGIRFKDSGKTYFFDPNGLLALAQGDQVIVETVRGLELAKVAYAPHNVPEAEIVGDLRPVVRRADQSDFDRMRLLGERHEEVLARCAEKIAEHTLPMRLVKAEYSFDGSRLTFYFTADKRIDFRSLVRDLARTFKTRIELRQIGPRDEAKLLGGIGPCGRLLCCATFLPDYARVSIKMAKDQDLPLNPSKISGVCGRLLCCLSYEHDQYLQIKAELPRRGAWVQTPDGPGEVVAVNVVRETVTVELAGSGAQDDYSPAQLGEAAQRVGELARGRAREGITPVAQEGGSAPPPRERRDPAERPRREPKYTGEKRLLRDTMDNPEVLEALALLEEGIEERAEATPAPTRSQPAGPPPPGGRNNRQEPDRHDHIRPRRRDQTPTHAEPAPQRPRQQTRPPEPGPGEPRQSPPPGEGMHDHRRRRRRGGRHGER
jgi:cell fate regulator YaaT (PSP1 superfamily)